MAATRCVKPSGGSGCYSSISAAVTAAAPNDTVRVYPGTYHEDVVIGKAVNLIGTNRDTTIVNASGKSNGFNIDGLNHPGLRNVTISGFTIENAKFEGIVATNASSLNLFNNHVTYNDKALVPPASCPGIPSWETAEGFDCGEGIHLSGVSGSVISGNVVDHNAGGILLSDDTGPNHGNLLSANSVSRNAYDCGITLASHPPAAVSGATNPLGVYQNTILGNESSYNGLATAGEGAGVGIFASVPGAAAYANSVSGNRLVGNGMPGVAIHSHTPGQNISRNVIAGNYIASNHADSDDAATPGSTGINVFGVSAATGTVIAENKIESEADAIVVNTPAQVNIHLNQFHEHEVGVNNIGPGSADATENYWGCSAGPSSGECAKVAGARVLFAPWLTQSLF
ncbi:MAG TPA: right-handed parallel beta-helix repeat-containing protein [Candidatus Koribacter sp.]